MLDVCHARGHHTTHLDIKVYESRDMNNLHKIEILFLKIVYDIFKNNYYNQTKPLAIN